MSSPATMEDAEDDLFEMANLHPRTSGLPMTVWVSPRGQARHDGRVEANMAHGDQMDVSNTAVIGVRPAPHFTSGRLALSDERAVCDWVALNTPALIEYWHGRIDTVQLAQMLRRLP